MMLFASLLSPWRMLLGKGLCADFLTPCIFSGQKMVLALFNAAIQTKSCVFTLQYTIVVFITFLLLLFLQETRRVPQRGSPLAEVPHGGSVPFQGQEAPGRVPKERNQVRNYKPGFLSKPKQKMFFSLFQENLGRSGSYVATCGTISKQRQQGLV